MKKTENVSSGVNYTAVDIGDFDDVSQYSMIHPRTGLLINKVFLKDVTEATGTEISVQSLAPHTELPYFHTHRKNEETWIVLKGEGKFQVDGECFLVREGSFIRVAPEGVRGICNTADTPMLYMVVQSLAGSLQEYSSADGTVVDTQTKW